MEKGSFGQWLRGLPLKPGCPKVRLFNGEAKGTQRIHCAVVDIDVGKQDLQQCADAIIRLRAEWMYSRGWSDAVSFHFTSGDLARWVDWKHGLRPLVAGSTVSWKRTGRRDGSRRSFRSYLTMVFRYAGTISLSKELKPASNPARVRPGDVFIQAGSPGHAVLVVDAAQDTAGRRVFLLAQSYMPAQDIHILKSFDRGIDPWYRAATKGRLVTPEWLFDYRDLKRLPLLGASGR